MQRIYIENLETSNYNFVSGDKDLYKQLIRVLRSEVWNKVIFFNGQDFVDYIFEIKKIEKKEIHFEQVWNIRKNNQTRFELNLFQALPNKIDKIESIIKNGTQIWITNFLFFKSERSQKLNISEKKIERLNKIILEASELCWRNIVPKLIIWNKVDFNNLEWKNIFMHTMSEKSKKLNEIDFSSDKIINLFVWPEGWFSDNEVWKFERNNCDRIFLWDNILRTELAWISVSFYLIQNNL